MITIFTDGAARGNPGPGGWGAIVVGEDLVVEMGGREDHTTNNRMELTAVIRALEAYPREYEAQIYTDSAYVLSGSTRWVQGWQHNDWKTSTKDDVLNRDLWEQMVEVMKGKRLNWRLIKGHSGIAPNERCDVIATSYADKVPIVLYQGSKERYGVNTQVTSSLGVDTKTKSKSKAYSYVSSIDGVVNIHKTWEECKARVVGVSGARHKKSTSPEDEDHIIEEFKK